MNHGEILLNTYVNQTAKKYTEFMNIGKLPPFKIVEKKISVSDANKKGFGSFASYHYDISTGAHTLKVWLNIYQPQFNAEYLLFHELTHLLDTEMYVKKDSIKKVMYNGFSEYHAGQIDFMKVLGAENIDSILNFSMKQIFKTVENIKTAEEYVIAAHNTSTRLISRSDFPADVQTLSAAFGLIFNYWGRRSICKMYAVDYIEKVDNETIEKFIGKETFKELDTLMNGWLTVDQVNLIGDFYYKMIVSKMMDYSL